MIQLQNLMYFKNKNFRRITLKRSFLAAPFFNVQLITRMHSFFENFLLFAELNQNCEPNFQTR